MNNTEILHAVIPLLSGVGGALGSIFWVKKWIQNTDKTLERLTREVQKLRTKVEVSTQIDNVTQGRLDETRKSIVRVSEKLEKTANAVDTLWYVIDKNKDVLNKS